MRIIVADDQVLVRAGILAILEEMGGIDCLASVADGRSCLSACQKSPPDILLLDVNMPGMNGLDVARAVRTQLPHVHIVFLTSSTDASLVRRAMELGARAFISKDFVLDELMLAIRSVMEGRTFISPDVASALMNEAAAPDTPRLTPRQMDVLRGIAAGQSNKEIARELAVSVKTVEYHRAELIQRLDLHDVASLTRFALEQGLVD